MAAMAAMAAASANSAARRLAAGSARRMVLVRATGWRAAAGRRAVSAGTLSAVAGGVTLGVAAAVCEPAARAEGGCDNPAAIAAVVLLGGAAAAYAAKLSTSSNVAPLDPDYRYMVDCGSGGTRVEKFGFGANGVYREAVSSPKAMPLHEALAKGEGEQKLWLAALAQTLGGDIASPIFIGATAGLRDAVASGAVSAGALKGFEALVSAQFGGRARFALVDGELEAASELAAVKYCLSARESPPPPSRHRLLSARVFIQTRHVLADATLRCGA
jgi:hypothetical protein